MNPLPLSNLQALKEKIPDSITLGTKTYTQKDFEEGRMPFEVSSDEKKELIIGSLEKLEAEKLGEISICDKIDDIQRFCLRSPASIFILRIPKGKRIEDPIILKYKPTEKPLAFSLFVIAEEDSACTLIEDWTDYVKSPAILYNQHSVIHANANLRRITLHNTSHETVLHENRHSFVEKGGDLTWNNFYFGSKESHLSLCQNTDEDGATVKSQLVFLAKGKQSFSCDCSHDHRNGAGSGTMEMKAVALEESRASLNGRIHIHQSAPKTSSHMHQETLNLSKKASIRAIPALQVDTNDVKASHGSSVRNLNPEQLLYFASRGLSPEESRKMLIAGFLKKELESVKAISGVYDYLKRLI